MTNYEIVNDTQPIQQAFIYLPSKTTWKDAIVQLHPITQVTGVISLVTLVYFSLAVLTGLAMFILSTLVIFSTVILALFSVVLIVSMIIGVKQNG